MDKYACLAHICTFVTVLECVIMEVKILGINYCCLTEAKVSNKLKKPVQSSALD